MNTTYRLNLCTGEGAVDANPRTYRAGTPLTLTVPLRPKHRFVGWIGEGIDVPTPALTIPADSVGDLTYTAVWEEIALKEDLLRRKYWGTDDGIPPNPANPDGSRLSDYDRLDDRGNALYVVKTVYTDIVLDGERDPAYSYGVHLSGALPSNKEYYRDRDTNIELWIVRGQDGRCYMFCDVTDPDIVVNEEMFAYRPYHCDAVHLYIEPGNPGICPRAHGVIVASEDPKFFRGRPKDCVVKRTERGFCFEVALDFDGMPYYEGDALGFSVYYNDTNEYRSVTDRQRAYVRLPSLRNPVTDEYCEPGEEKNDAVVFSVNSATGRIVDNVRPEPTGDLMTDVLSGAREVAVLYDEIAPAHTLLAAQEIVRNLCSHGASATLRAYSAEDAVSDAVQIHVGRTAHPASVARDAGIAYNEFELFLDGDRIFLSAWKEDAVNTAKGALLSLIEYVRNGGDAKTLETLYRGVLEGVPGAEIPRMEGLSSVTDAADGSYQLLKLNATKRDFVNYCRSLKNAGFALHAENRMTSVHCATYYNETAIVNVTYGENKGDRSLRAVVDPRTESTLPVAIPAAYTPICKTTVTQLAPLHITWMTYVIRQDNGEFFIIDAGGNSRYLYDSLMRMNDGKPVVVSAWLFTHFHIDHVNGFVDLVLDDERMRNISVRSIIYNFPQQQVIDTARRSAGDMRNMRLWKSVVQKTGATVYKARTGQKYRFGNVELEMLFTFEDLAPYRILIDRSNPTSHIFSMKINGQRFMILGDASREATELAVLRYGKDLKSDFVQLSHHGHGDGRTDPRFYPTVDAPWVLWPGTTEGPCPSGKAETWAVQHAEKFFKYRSGDTVLSVPYNGETVEGENS